MTGRGVVICGGEFHDFDYVGSELVTELERRTSRDILLLDSYPEDAESLTGVEFLVTYTCNVVPTTGGLSLLLDFLLSGRRWLALHATNAMLEPPASEGGRWRTSNSAPEFAELLGSRFLAHPPLQKFTVTGVAESPLLDGARHFEIVDELYVSEWLAPVQALMASHFGGECPAFEAGHDVPEADQTIMYTRRIGAGEICYLSLGHANAEANGRKAHYGAWQTLAFRHLLGNCLGWVSGA